MLIPLGGSADWMKEWKIEGRPGLMAAGFGFILRGTGR
jgi:hypothetical protein